MKGILNKFRKRNIQTNLPHFILVIFIVAVSVCLITGLFISHLTLSHSINNFYQESNLPNLWIEADGVTHEDEEFFAKYDYSKRYVFENDIVIGDNNYSSKIFISDGEVSRPYLVEGEKGNGCYINEKFVKQHKIGLNYSKIYFDYTINGETRRLDFKVLGSLALAEKLVASDECVIFIDEKYFLEKLNSQFSDVFGDNISIDYNQILITSKILQTDIDCIENYYNSESNSVLKSIKTQFEMESFQKVAEEIKISNLMLYIFPLLFVLVSILVVISSIVELVARERYNIGLLKSFGISRKKILSNYCGYGVFVCLIGALIGILISPLIIPNMTFETFDIILNIPRDEVKMMIPFWLVVAVVILSILVGYFSAFFVCFRLTLKTPKECMSGFKIIPQKKRRTKSFGKIGSVFRSMKNNMPRTIMSVIAIAGCSLLSLIGFSVKGIGEGFDFGKIKTLETFSNIFQGFSVAILLLSIIILITQIFKEKSQEMAMLKIHGKSNLRIWLSVLLEMSIVGLLGFVIAGLICQPVFILMLRLFGIKKVILINFLGFLKTFLLLAGTILIISLTGLVRIYKLNLSDATKLYE